VDGANYCREVFASAVDRVLAVRFTCDKPGRITCTANLTRPREAQTAAAGNDRLVLSGVCNGGNGIKFQAQVQAVAEGGRHTTGPRSLSIAGANSLTLLLASATTYRGNDSEAACLKKLRAAAAKGYDVLKSDHVKDHRALFRRVELDLGPAPQPDQPTDERLAALRTGGDDPTLVALFFQFGRYILMASSRPGSLPANLQGIWNEDMEAPWNADFHTNINLQENYWPAEVCNLAECHLPLFDLMDSLVTPGRETARRHYGARGWVVHHLTDPWGFTVPADGLWGVWPVGAAWLCQHPFEHYRYSGDKEFLARRAWPLMKGAARFILDFLVEAPPGTPAAGRLVTAPSHSPENAFRIPGGKTAVLTYAATMDLEIIHDLFTNCIEAIDVLGPDGRFEAGLRAELVAALKRLAPLQISKRTGALQEWIADYEEPEPDHRHISHVYALYPGRQITPRGTPELAEAVRKTLVRRGDGSSAWSRAWKVNAWARLEDGDRAHKILKGLLATSIRRNLFDTEPSLLVDANLAATAGIAEMLLQSHAGEIALLPALPRAWQTGRVTGLRARGGIEVDIAWQDGRATEATLRASRAGGYVIRAPKGQRIAKVVDAMGKPLVLEATDGVVRVDMAAGQWYHLSFGARD
jgi:alpha-L-fucosidase 2